MTLLRHVETAKVCQTNKLTNLGESRICLPGFFSEENPFRDVFLFVWNYFIILAPKKTHGRNLSLQIFVPIKTLDGGFKYFLCSPLLGEDEPILTSIFFKWVGSTTNKIHCFFVPCPDSRVPMAAVVYQGGSKENCEISPSMLDALPVLQVLESPTCQLSEDFRCGQRVTWTMELFKDLSLPETNSKSPWKSMVGRWNFRFGSRPIFRGELLVLGSVLFLDVSQKISNCFSWIMGRSGICLLFLGWDWKFEESSTDIFFWVEGSCAPWIWFFRPRFRHRA